VSAAPISYDDTFDAIVSYASSPEYLASSAAEKREALWVAGQKTRYAELPPMRYSMIAATLGMLNIWLLRRAFHTVTDVRPPRTKLFHPFGSCAKVEYVPGAGHGFTGIYETGAIGLARLSLAMDAAAFMPAAGFKWFVDGRESQNLLLDRSLNPDPVKDFFTSYPTNISQAASIPPLGPNWWIIRPWLAMISYPIAQPVTQLATITRYGETVAAPRSPFQIFATPSDAVRAISNATDDYRVSLGRIPPGTVLYELTAIASKGDTAMLPLGYVKTDSEFTASAFQDRVLSLHHTVTTSKDW
jgi:hypothetical protein